MKTPALVISKDLVKELKRLAVIAIDDESNFGKVRDRYIAAGNKHSSSTSEFAVTLYTFVQQYADQHSLIDAKLSELGITYDSTSVYHKIVRLAVDDVPNKDSSAVRMYVSRYGRLMEAAYVSGISATEFKAKVDKGITATMRSLGVIPVDKPKAIALGRAEASNNLSNMTFPLQGVAPPPGIADGDEIELVARYENGQIVVYGMIPPSVSAPKAVLTKLGSSLLPPTRKPLDLLPHLQRVLKLVTNGKDPDKLASYTVSNSEVQFTVVGDGAVATLSAPLDFDFLSGNGITLPVSKWGDICFTLMPISKHVRAVGWDKDTLVVTADEFEVPDVKLWYQDKGKSPTLGEAVDASIFIELDGGTQTATHIVATSAWSGGQSFGEAKLAPLMQHEPGKPIATFQLGPVLSVKGAKAAVAGNINVNKGQLKLLKAVCSKLLRLATNSEVTLDQAAGYLRVSASAENAMSYSVIFEVQ